MLNIYLKKENTHIKEDSIIRDVEKEFDKLQIQGTSIERQLIKLIEKGKYNDDVSFIDRFGYKLHYEDMSTGCKAALCIANRPNKVVDLIECGYNARDIIIKTCNTGGILIEDDGLTISPEYGLDVDVQINNKHFNNIHKLNKYIQFDIVLDNQ